MESIQSRSVREREGTRLGPSTSRATLRTLSRPRSRLAPVGLPAKVEPRQDQAEDRPSPSARCRRRSSFPHPHLNLPLSLTLQQLLPTEVALHIFSYLPPKTLLQCGLVCRRWRTLADDYTLWKRLCAIKGWHWKNPPSRPRLQPSTSQPSQHDTDDEGMGDEEIQMTPEMHSRAMDDSGFASFLSDDPWEESSFMATRLSPNQPSTVPAHSTNLSVQSGSGRPATRIPSSAAPSAQSFQNQRPNYKLLHLTRTRLQHRFLSGSYRLSTLQSRGTPGSHTNTIYCLQLYTYPSTDNQVLFTGSKDRTIKEWDLATGTVLRTIEGVHEGSVLSMCVYGHCLASAGSDSNVVVWDLVQDKVVKVIDDHEDSVLCVRFDDVRLVSCSKGECVTEWLLPRLMPYLQDRTVRTYLFPDLNPQHIMTGHRAAVNALSISRTHIVSASGDRSLRLWDANTGALLRTFENHHSRGYVTSSLLIRYPIWRHLSDTHPSAALHQSIWISPSFFRAPRTNMLGFSTSSLRLGGPRRPNLTHKRQSRYLYHLFWAKIPPRKIPRLRSVRTVASMSA